MKLLVNLLEPVGRLVPFFILYKISSKASLNLLPYIASILFKFSLENISSAFCCHSAKNSDLASPIEPSLNKSDAIFSTSQYSLGFPYPSSFLDIKPKVSAKACNSGSFLTILSRAFKSLLDSPGTSNPALFHR